MSSKPIPIATSFSKDPIPAHSADAPEYYRCAKTRSAQIHKIDFLFVPLVLVMARPYYAKILGKELVLSRCFHVVDLNTVGDVQSTAEYAYAQLEQVPGAADLIIHFATTIYRSPDEFESWLPGCKNLLYRWRASAQTAGIATLRNNGALTSLGLLASGIDADADRITLDAFQKHLIRELHNTQFEPSFALMDLRQRPLVAVVPFEEPQGTADKLMAALADRCFAAAYFRYLNLA